MSGRRQEGSTAIVTGAGSGLGRAVARQLADEGARVVGVDVNRTGLMDTMDALAMPGLAVVADVSVPAEVNRIVATATGADGDGGGDGGNGGGGRIDVLVNNAAVLDRLLPVIECDDDTWARVLGINLSGPFLLCRAVLPLMVARGRGAIVNLSSVAGIRGGRGGAAYTVSKHGVIGLTRAVAAEYGEDGVRCNAVCPGGISTGIGRGETRSEHGMAMLERTIPKGWGHVAEPEELADIVCFLASADARNVNGAVVVGDGGWTSI